MQVRTVLRGLVVPTVLAVLAAMLPQLASAGPRGASGRYLVVARSSADYAALRAKAVKEGAHVLRDLPQAKTIVVSAPASARSSLAADRRTLGVARDQVRRLPIDRSARNLADPGLRSATQLKATAPAATTAAGINPDPAFDYKGLLWDYRRAHRATQGLEDHRRQPQGDRRGGRHRPRLHPPRAAQQGQAGDRLHGAGGPANL